MGSLVEINDTLQISRKQGFPLELDFERHCKKPFSVEDFQEKVFEFHGKDGIRIFHAPPVRVFLAENRDGKWLYWGLVHILEITHDFKNRTTSGKFRIIYIYSPEEMRLAHSLIDRNPNTDFFQSH